MLQRCPIAAIALLALAMVGCDGDGSHVSPLVSLASVEAGGAGVRGVIGNTRVEYTPDRYFGVAFLVKNRTDRSMTITQVSGTDTGGRFLQLVGVKLVPFTRRPCPASCPAPSLGLVAPFRELPPELPPLQAFELQPHRSAGLVLHFRWVACNEAPARTSERDNRSLRVKYRMGGRTRTQILRTGPASLLVRRPSGCAMAGWDTLLRHWRQQLSAAADKDRNVKFPTPDRADFEKKLAAAATQFGFRVLSTEFVRAPQGSPLVIVESSTPTRFAQDTPAILRLLDPREGSGEDWQGWDYEGFFLGAQDQYGEPFLAIFNVMRDHGGGQWARSEDLYAFPHG